MAEDGGSITGYLIAGISALSGGVIWLFKLRDGSQTAEIKRLRTVVEALEAKCNDHESRIVAYEREKVTLNAKFQAFVSSHHASPLPMWIKDRNGRVLSCNKAYEKHFLAAMGKTLFDYIDHYDYDIWPEHVAQEFKLNDLKTLTLQETTDQFETVPSEADSKRQMRVIKWPVYAPGIDVPYAVAGVAIVEMN